MASTDISTVLSLAFRQLSDGLHQASVACKDLEYNIPLLLGKSDGSSTKTTAQAPPSTEKTKRVRDPNEPRRPPSAYLLFTSKARADVTKSEPELKPAEVMSKLAELWKDLSDSDKQPYEDEAERLKEGYVREREQYEKDHPDQAKKRRRVNPQPSKGEAQTLPSPIASPAVEARAPVTPSKAKAPAKEKSSKKDKSPKSDRKTKEKEKEKEKEPEKEKKKRRKSETKSK